ncbi:MAG: glutamate racemase [Clostridia bacterium]|nr:glutamate racemase [Clostridia bacterium]
MSYSKPIGVFDSGLGGISVLRALRVLMPSENFVYFADRRNAPYGSRPDIEIIHLTRNGIEYLRRLGCKAAVIACNTATSVAAEILRKEYSSFAIIGLEPAIKPAINKYPDGNVLVLATPVTLNHKKFINLLSSLDGHNVVALAAPKLVTYVEGDTANSSGCLKYLSSLFAEYNCVRFDACVLGCTHFPFAKHTISCALGYSPEFFDGAQGAAHHLRDVLASENMLNKDNKNGYIFWNELYSNGLNRKLLYDKYN